MRKMMTTLLATGAVLLAMPAMSQALNGADSALRLKAQERAALEGKTIAFVPQILSSALATAWAREMQKEADHFGMQLVVRDPNWNANAHLQVVSALIDERPDVIVLQNPNVTILAKELQRAEEAGIHVIQISMASNYKTDVYTGADWARIGTELAQDVIAQCGPASGKSGKVQIVMGEPTGGTNLETVQAMNEVFKSEPSINVVSTQAADWDATKAYQITSTVLQQHPDLCASVGMWGTMHQGAAQAIRDAGLLDKVWVTTSGEGPRTDCDAVQQGLFDRYINYDARRQGHDVIMLARTLLQSGLKPGSVRIAAYSYSEWQDKDSAVGNACFDL